LRRGLPGQSAAERGRRPGRHWPGAFSRDVLLLVCATALFTVLVKAFIAQAFLIPSGSMEQTLRPGERVLVNKLVYRIRGVQRGDIVVFSGTGSWGPSPAPSANPVLRWYHDTLTATGLATSGTDYIKRVVGLPGDHVACCDAWGRITVNGVPLREDSYLYPGERPSRERFSVTVPPGRLWVMGDHRMDSADSRDHTDDPGEGTIPESAVVGRAFLVIWPLSQVHSLRIPGTFAQPTLGRGASSDAMSLRVDAAGPRIGQARPAAGQRPRRRAVGAALGSSQ
jgi:signal peptidase I